VPTLKEAREVYYEASGTVSTLCRQLSLAGIAVVWMFKSGTNSGNAPFSNCLLWALLLFVLSLASDILHYVWRTFVYGWFQWRTEKEYQKQGLRHPEIESQVFTYPRFFNRVSLVFFWLKVILCLAGLFIMVLYIGSTLR